MGSSRVTPSIVAWYSAIASSSADWVFGIARLISSTSRTFANTGTGPELEVAVSLVEDGEAGDVGRLEVGRALDACEGRALDRTCDRSGQHGLRRARHVLEQHVAVTDECREDQPHLVGLSVDDRLDVREQPIGDLRRLPEVPSDFGHVRLLYVRMSLLYPAR